MAEAQLGDGYVVQNGAEVPGPVSSCRISKNTWAHWVISWEALILATTLLSTSLTMDGNTRSSQSSPRRWYMLGSSVALGRDSTRREMFPTCRSLEPVGEEIFRGLVPMS